MSKSGSGSGSEDSAGSDNKARVFDDNTMSSGLMKSNSQDFEEGPPAQERGLQSSSLCSSADLEGEEGEEGDEDKRERKLRGKEAARILKEDRMAVRSERGLAGHTVGMAADIIDMKLTLLNDTKDTAKNVLTDTKNAAKQMGKIVSRQGIDGGLKDATKNVAVGAVDATMAVSQVPMNFIKSSVKAGASATGGTMAVGGALYGAAKETVTKSSGPRPMLPDHYDLKECWERCQADAETTEAADAHTRNWIFAALCILETMANFDAGVLPVTIAHIMAEFGLDYAQAGILGALVYLGLVVGAPISGYLLTAWESQRKLLMCACASNAVCVALLALAQTKTQLFIARALVGLTQAPFFIYCPVWVDEFAPHASAGTWMSALQANVAGGIMLGYVVAGMICTYWGPETCPPGHHDEGMAGQHGCYNSRWRYPLMFQAFGIACFAVFFARVKGRLINARGGASERNAFRSRKNLVREMRQYSNGQDALNLFGVIDKRMEGKYEGARGVKKWLGKAQGGFKKRRRDPAQPDTPRAPGSSTPTPRYHPEDHADGGNLIEEAAEVVGEHALGESLGILDMFGDHDEDQTENDSIADSHFCKQMSLLLTCKLYVCVTLGLTGLYFVVTGVQFWVTDYLTLPVEEGGLGQPLGTVVLAFSLSSLTGPTAGVFLGGYVVDKQGGYQDVDGTGYQPMLAMKSCVWFATGCLTFAIPTAFSGNFYVAMGAMWFVLLFGGAIVSPATGVMIVAVHPDLRSWSAAMSLFVYNILGYALAPFLCGILASIFDLATGFRIVIIGGCLYTYVGLIAAFLVARSEHNRKKKEPVPYDKNDINVDNPMLDANTPRNYGSPSSYDSQDSSGSGSPRGRSFSGTFESEGAPSPSPSLSFESEEVLSPSQAQRKKAQPGGAQDYQAGRRKKNADGRVQGKAQGDQGSDDADSVELSIDDYMLELKSKHTEELAGGADIGVEMETTTPRYPPPDMDEKEREITPEPNEGTSVKRFRMGDSITEVE